jgi:hypothetical protein
MAVQKPVGKAAARKRAVKPPVLPNRKAVLATLERLGADPGSDALAQLALTLADELDAGAGMATAAISRELRATLSELSESGGDGDELDVFLAGLSAQVVDSKD